MEMTFRKAGNGAPRVKRPRASDQSGWISSPPPSRPPLSSWGSMPLREPTNNGQRFDTTAPHPIGADGLPSANSTRAFGHAAGCQRPPGQPRTSSASLCGTARIPANCRNRTRRYHRDRKTTPTSSELHPGHPPCADLPTDPAFTLGARAPAQSRKKQTWCWRRCTSRKHDHKRCVVEIRDTCKLAISFETLAACVPSTCVHLIRTLMRAPLLERFSLFLWCAA